MEYATRLLYFPYTHEPLGECVYEENTSDKWLPMPKSSENLWKFWEGLENFGNASNPFYRSLNDL